MENYIVAAILVLAVGVAIFYIVKAKKSGKKCIGCPYADSCGKSNCCPGDKTWFLPNKSFLTPLYKYLRFLAKIIAQFLMFFYTKKQTEMLSLLSLNGGVDVH